MFDLTTIFVGTCLLLFALLTFTHALYKELFANIRLFMECQRIYAASQNKCTTYVAYQPIHLLPSWYSETIFTNMQIVYKDLN